jgi:Rhodopirellula transposase DDE domain
VPPPKKVPQTDAIFAHLSQVHQAAGGDAAVVRLSLDSKAAVALGPFARGGSSRTGIRAVDHDFKPLGKLTPFGIFWLGAKELSLYFTATKVSSDFIVDRLAEWWQRHRGGLDGVRRLLLDLDNGPENHGYRSQFLYRLVCLAQAEQLAIELAYYPPYHSKYNPIERCWGVLENYWRGELLDSEEAVLGFARNMTYAQRHPEVYRVAQEYAKGARRTRAEKKWLEQWIERTPGLQKWAVLIHPPSPDQLII